MKKIIKILLTKIFIIFSIIAINKIINNFLNDRLLFIVLAFALFAIHLFAWISPRTLFNLCWKVTGILPDNFDYDTSYSKLEMVDIVVLITSTLLIIISLLFN